jgi:hypothetical protein
MRTQTDRSDLLTREPVSLIYRADFATREDAERREHKLEVDEVMSRWGGIDCHGRSVLTDSPRIVWPDESDEAD